MADRKHEIVRVCELTVSEDIVGDITFEDVQFIGPAIVVFENCTLEYSTGSAVPVGAGCEGRYVSIRPVSITGRRIAMPANLRSPGGADISRPGRCRDRHDGDTGRAQRRLAAASWRPASSKGRPACRLWALGPWTRR